MEWSTVQYSTVQYSIEKSRFIAKRTENLPYKTSSLPPEVAFSHPGRVKPEHPSLLSRGLEPPVQLLPEHLLGSQGDLWPD